MNTNQTKADRTNAPVQNTGVSPMLAACSRCDLLCFHSYSCPFVLFVAKTHFLHLSTDVIPMPTLANTVNGIALPNPFVIGSGPPGTNANVCGKAFDEGWGAVIIKTISLDSSKVTNVAPRYARLRTTSKEVIGWQNIELISDRPFSVWLDELKLLKDKYPDGKVIASIMEEYNKDAWIEIVERVQATGVAGFELNFSCPHGLPERKMGAAMGQDNSIMGEVCRWVMSAAKVPVWAKLTAQRHQHRRRRRSRLSRRLRWRERDQHDPLRDGRRSRNPPPGAHGGRLHRPRRLQLHGRQTHRASHGQRLRRSDPRQTRRQNPQRHRRS